MRPWPLAALLAGCGPTAGPPAGTPSPEPTPGGDDDDTAATPTLSVSPSSVSAGAIEDVTVEVSDFSFDGSSTECCSGGQAQVIGPGDEPMVLEMFFGLHAAGTVPWGLSGPQGQVETSFEVAPLPAPPPIDRTADVGFDGPGAFAAFAIDVAEPRMLSVRAVDPVAPFFRPRLWLIDPDGARIEARGGEHEGGDVWSDPRLDRAVAPGRWYLRVDDADRRGGPGYAGTVQVGQTPVLDPIAIPEVEPNDADWMELGPLPEAALILSGVATTAGHGGDNEPNGDLDVFVFELPRPGRLRLLLDWSGNDDFDAVLYDHRYGAQLGFESPDAVQLSMLASVDHPETGELELEGGTPYALLIANWAGLDGTPWTMRLELLPEPWPAD